VTYIERSRFRTQVLELSVVLPAAARPQVTKFTRALKSRNIRTCKSAAASKALNSSLSLFVALLRSVSRWQSVKCKASSVATSQHRRHRQRSSGLSLGNDLKSVLVAA